MPECGKSKQARRRVAGVAAHIVAEVFGKLRPLLRILLIVLLKVLKYISIYNLAPDHGLITEKVCKFTFFGKY